MANIKTLLNGLSFKTGIIVLCLCIPFYILSFVQMSMDFSIGMKGVLFVVFFGLAKTFQYAGLAIIGADGIKALRNYLKRKKT